MARRGWLVGAVGLALSALGASAAPAPSLDPWPRTISASDVTLVVYQPQVESWTGNHLAFRAAVGATPAGASHPDYGVVWGSASTEVDRGTRQVALSGLKLERASFPTAPERADAYLGALRTNLSLAGRTVALDRLEASLAASGSARPQQVPVKNDPPRILVSQTPAVLIPIDGKPELRPVPNSGYLRVINTRALLLQETLSDIYYLHLYDGWLRANAPEGPWTLADVVPIGIDDVANPLVMQHLVDPLDGGATQPPPSLANGVPTVYTSTTPAELLVFSGPPDYQPVGSTGLLWATNTRSDVLVNTADSQTYVLLSGRWYRAPSLDGPWSHVASASLPDVFRTIPPASPAAVVLPAVAGTKQAREAVIENSIPQTASVPITGGPSFSASYDGKPQLRPIEGTQLQYIANSATPVIRFDSSHWYALVAGVWFAAAGPQGPWHVATSVPAAIYAIPPSHPLYYVTYVQVYGATDTVVYEGYTPGYLGTVVSTDDVVVYGTGYDYDPWIGGSWYAAPETFGVMAQPVYNPAVGYTYGFALGLTTAAVAASWASPVYYDTYYHGYPCCGSASANVYGHYGYTSAAGKQTWYANSNGTVGVKGSGSYDDARTGTTGSYDANRSDNPYSGEQKASMDRSYDRASGGSGEVNRDASYDGSNGKGSYDASRETTTAGGNTVTHDVSAGSGEGVQRSTSFENSQTGQTRSFESGSDDGQRYAGADGNVYKSDGAGGWQQAAGNGGWQQAGAGNDWADREQQARASGDDRMSGFQGGGYADRGDGGGFGGDRGGMGGGGMGDRFGGGGFGGRFGGGGFGGFRGGRR